MGFSPAGPQWTISAEGRSGELGTGNSEVPHDVPRRSPVLSGTRMRLSERAVPRLRVVVSGMASDARTWNLVYLQLLLEDLGHDVTNLGACVEDETIVSSCRQAGE